MASRGSSTRSAARATSSALSASPARRAYRRLPTRWRLAGGSAALTFVILCGFAVDRRAADDAPDPHPVRRLGAPDRQLPAEPRARIELRPRDRRGRTAAGSATSPAARTRRCASTTSTLPPQLMCAYGGATPAVAALLARRLVPEGAARLPRRGARRSASTRSARAVLVYARPLSAIDRTAAKVRFFLILGVLGGSGLALLAGLMVARRAMAPIAALTASAREIERTRDPGRHIPQPEADDEVAELARTLEDMLQALDAARARDGGDARSASASSSPTPRTSCARRSRACSRTSSCSPSRSTARTREAAVASALRSSQRMRRLVADLLLLARADAGRTVPHRPVDLAQVLVEVAAELEPLAERGDRHLTIAAHEPLVGRRRARRAAPARAEPDRERAAPHAARHARPRGACERAARTSC